MRRTLLQQCRWLLPALLLAMPAAFADEHDEGMLATKPDATEETLILPDEAAPEGHENSAYGLEQANEARDARRAFGESRAEAAGDNRDSATRD